MIRQLSSDRLLLLLAGLFVAVASHAQAVSDPTRPAIAWLAVQPKATGVVVAEPESGTPGAQIVVVGPSRKFAMVDGNAVRTGETYKGAKLLGIGSDSLTWQNGEKREMASMSPAVVKTPPATHQPPPPGTKSRTKTLNGGPQ